MPTDKVFTRAVGGISIDADGLLNSAKLDDLGALSRMRRQAMQKNSRRTERRRGACARFRCAGWKRPWKTAQRSNKPVPDDDQVSRRPAAHQYVFVYPEQKDIVLVGPGEGWKVDAKGNVVGVDQRPAGDVAGQPAGGAPDCAAAAKGGITCSIDPTAEGLQRMSQDHVGPRAERRQAKAFADAAAERLGMQQISLHGVPATSHFARVLGGGRLPHEDAWR